MSTPSSVCRRLAVACAVALALPVVAAGPASAAASRVCQVDDGRLTEASGAVASGRHDGVWFSHNDRGHAPRAVAIDTRCHVLGEAGWGRDATDVEDVGRSEVDGRPFLFFADTGDNARSRSSVEIVRIPVPVAPYAETATPTVFPLRYPDGPHDVETILVAPDGLSAVLVEKDADSPGLWLADLRAPGSTPTLASLGRVHLPEGLASSLVTSGSVSPDGSRVALRTYREVVVWPLPPTGAFGTRVSRGLAGDGVRVRVPEQEQGEGLDWDDDGLRLVSEGRPADVVRVPSTDLPDRTFPVRRLRLA